MIISLTKKVFLILIISLVLPQLSAHAKDYLIFVDGDNDCCASGMNRVKKYANNNGLYFIDVVWSNFKQNWRSGVALNDEGKRRFVKTGTKYLSSLPKGSNVYLIGHSWGGDSALRLVREYKNTNINFKLLALIDPIGPGGMRKNLLNNTVPNKVEYFFNRWQTNQPFPIDVKTNGKIKCQAKTCNQKEHSTHKNSNGSSVKKKCGWHEFGCSGRRENPLNSHPGYKMKRVGHQGITTDAYIEHQIIDILKRLNDAGKELKSIWKPINGKLTQVSVGNKKTVWGVNSSDNIYRRDGNKWTQIKGKLKQISVRNGVIFGVNNKNNIFWK